MNSQVKFIIIGDKGVGKRSILSRLTSGNYPKENISVENQPQLFAKVILSPPIKEYLMTNNSNSLSPVKINRQLEGDVALIIFSVVKPNSFYNALNKVVKSNIQQWFPYVVQSAPEVPIIFIGNKTDLREIKQSSGQDIVDTEMAQDGLKKIESPFYLECSAKRNEGFHQIIQLSVIQSQKFKRTKESGKQSMCCIF